MWTRVLVWGLIFCSAAVAQLPTLRVSDNKRFLVTSDGKPFFYLADTAWELFHRLNREQAAKYLDKRASQGYTAIQAVAIAELDGATVPNAYGHLPLVDRDPARPAVSSGADYWDHVDYIVDQANRRGMYMAMLPAWGRWVTDTQRNDNIITTANAQAYGEFLGKRYAKKGIIWVLGGDRNTAGFEDVWRALARGIAIGVSGKEDYDAVLMTFHPRGAQTSSTTFHNDRWLDFNMHQTGHSRAERTMSWDRIAKDYQLEPVKPVLDGEPLYEDHPIEFRAAEHGYSFDAHIRQRAYWAVFAGGAGHTYGNHSVWQMYGEGRRPVNGPLHSWEVAIDRPGAAQMQYVRYLMESRPYQTGAPDTELVVDPLTGADRIVATRGEGYAFIYSAQGRKFTARTGRIAQGRIVATWYNPRSGELREAGTSEGGADKEFTCPSEGFGSDWVLVLDDASKNFKRPGAR